MPEREVKVSVKERFENKIAESSKTEDSCKVGEKLGLEVDKVVDISTKENYTVLSNILDALRPV